MASIEQLISLGYFILFIITPHKCSASSQYDDYSYSKPPSEDHQRDKPHYSQALSTTPPADIMTPANTTSAATLSQQDSFNLSRDIATQFVLSKVLRALGPKFEVRLPTAPTNATLTPLNSTLRVETGLCPSRYRRCSSQTFYPSCEIPRNTDEQMWGRRFTLFFNISSEISSIDRGDVLNATLRLYKNISLPLSKPMDLIVKLHAFTRSLKRNREHSVAVAATRVSSDYVGWVFINVDRLVRRLKGRFNYGVKITLQNEKNIPWNIPDLFVKMDCQASNETLVPLPFEVKLDDTAQRYPALNIRSGSQEIFTDNTDYLTEFGYGRPTYPLSPNNGFPLRRRPIKQNNRRRPNLHHQRMSPLGGAHGTSNLDQLVNPHLYSGDNNSQVEDEDSDNPSYYDEIPTDKYNSESSDNDNNYIDQQSAPIWSTGNPSYEQSFIQNGRHQARYKKQTTPSSIASDQYHRTRNNRPQKHYQRYDQRHSLSQENLIEDSPQFADSSANDNQRRYNFDDDYQPSRSHNQDTQEYDTDYSRDSYSNNRQRIYSREYYDEYSGESLAPRHRMNNINHRQQNHNRGNNHDANTYDRMEESDRSSSEAQQHRNSNTYSSEHTPSHHGVNNNYHNRFIHGGQFVSNHHRRQHRHHRPQHRRQRHRQVPVTTTDSSVSSNIHSNALSSAEQQPSQDIL